jgi:hypothetical protein
VANFLKLEDCTKENGDIEIAAYSPIKDSQVHPMQETAPCSSLKVADITTLRLWVGECASILKNPRHPLVHSARVIDSSFFYQGTRSAILVECDDHRIQIRVGSYGNREGSEIEHLYEPVSIGAGGGIQARTLRSSYRMVTLEAFGGW